MRDGWCISVRQGLAEIARSGPSPHIVAVVLGPALEALGASRPLYLPLFYIQTLGASLQKASWRCSTSSSTWTAAASSLSLTRAVLRRQPQLHLLTLKMECHLPLQLRLRRRGAAGAGVRACTSSTSGSEGWSTRDLLLQ